MPELQPYDTPYPNAVVGWTGLIWRCLHVDAAGDLQVDVISTVMDAAAATVANQALILAQLQLIEDLRNALQSVAIDRLIVRGEAQLFNFQGVLSEDYTPVVGAGNDYVDSTACGAGEFWCVTNIAWRNRNNAITAWEFQLRHNGDVTRFAQLTEAVGANVWRYWQGEVYLDNADIIRLVMVGSAPGDLCDFDLSGYEMTRET